jgi:hypothetical protein
MVSERRLDGDQQSFAEVSVVASKQEPKGSTAALWEIREIAEVLLRPESREEGVAEQAGSWRLNRVE